jgi:transcriptional regulator with XRE-family HTH domain
MADVRPGELLSARLGAEAKRIRLDRKISQTELAAATGLGQAFISRMEAGREFNLQLGTLERLADGLGVQLAVRLVE